MRRLFAGMALAAMFIASAHSAGEHARRLSAEIAVMQGDVRRLSALPPAREGEGIIRRLGGALAGLPLLMRQARDADPTLPAAPLDLGGVSASLAARDWSAAAAALLRLARAFPFDATPLVLTKPSAAQLRLGKSIHEETCAGCHDNPDPDAMWPAHDLFHWAKVIPAEEFAARLYAGVRGDALTALANPFGASELAALFAYYREGSGDLPKE